jgi:hypothetical protein
VQLLEPKESSTLRYHLGGSHDVRSSVEIALRVAADKFSVLGCEHDITLDNAGSLDRGGTIIFEYVLGKLRGCTKVTNREVRCG